ncbi:MAG: hypothetical protein ACPGXL_01175 [Chitinophagales bacterium]
MCYKQLSYFLIATLFFFTSTLTILGQSNCVLEISEVSVPKEANIGASINVSGKLTNTSTQRCSCSDIELRISVSDDAALISDFNDKNGKTSKKVGILKDAKVKRSSLNMPATLKPGETTNFNSQVAVDGHLFDILPDVQRNKNVIIIWTTDVESPDRDDSIINYYHQPILIANDKGTEVAKSN